MTRDWGHIGTGATFEALAATLIFFEDSSTSLFGRAGKDGGQDVRSGDGTRIYQAKFHQNRSAARAIADAKREAAKVATNRRPGAAREGQWRAASHWTLVTNAEFNPTDRETWEMEVVPLFGAQGLVAAYWERAHMDALLDKHPEVERAFFKNEPRAMLSLPEVRERLVVEEPLLRSSSQAGFFGRNGELDQLLEFLVSQALFLVVHGPGGVGKTRYLLEGGQLVAEVGGWQVLWANTATMAAAAGWFDGVVPERQTLLLVDEPSDDQLLRLLAEQIGGRIGRAARWKIAVAVRSPKDPVLRFLRGPKVSGRVVEAGLDVLATPAARQMCLDLLSHSQLSGRTGEWRAHAAIELSRRFGNHPVWMALAVSVLESKGELSELPDSASGLAELYVSEIVEHQPATPPGHVLSLLRWVALLGTVNRQDAGLIQLIARETPYEEPVLVLEALSTLVRRRALIERGAGKRLVEVKPDVLRDHILWQWLAVNTGVGPTPLQPSPQSIELNQAIADRVLSGEVTSADRAMLTSIARTDFMLRLSGKPVDLLSVFFARLADRVEKMPAGVAKVVAEVLLDVAPARPSEVTAVMKSIRLAPLPPQRHETLLGSFETTRKDVLGELAWTVFHAGIGAVTLPEQRQVLEELCALTEEEANIAAAEGQLRPDGKRASALLGRVVHGGPEVRGSFDAATEWLGLGMLERLAVEPPSAPQASVALALLEPALSLERTQSWSEGYQFHIRTYLVSPGTEAWNTQERLSARIRELLAMSSTPLRSRVLFWQVLADAHSSGVRGHRHVTDSDSDAAEARLIADLEWAASLLASGAAPFEELVAARALWEWHVRFDEKGRAKELAESLETLYSTNALAAEMEPIFGGDDWQLQADATAAKAVALALTDKSEIEGFLHRAERFLADRKHRHDLSHVAAELGRQARQSSGVRTFVTQQLGDETVNQGARIAAIAASSWVAAERAAGSPDAAFTLVQSLLGFCGDDRQRVELLSWLYGRSARTSIGVGLAAGEREFVLLFGALFERQDERARFIHVAATVCGTDWLAFVESASRVVDTAPMERQPPVVEAAVEQLYLLTRATPIEEPRPLVSWVLEQVLLLPDLDPPGGSLTWQVEEILKRLGRLPLSWLPGAIERRVEMEQHAEGRRIRAFGYRTHIGRFVQAVDEATALDPSTRVAVDRLLGFVSTGGSAFYYLPTILRDVDPNGLVVPAAVAERVATADGLVLWSLARLATAYVIGSGPWRQIAGPVLKMAHVATDDDRRSLFNALTSKETEAWSSAVGDVPRLFRDAVDEARQRFESETNVDFRTLWSWSLEVAEARLRAEEESAKEERGE